MIVAVADTHALVWAILGDARLSPSARAAMTVSARSDHRRHRRSPARSRDKSRRQDPRVGDRDHPVSQLADGQSPEDILAAYPYLERADIQAALAFAASRLKD